VQEPRRVEQVAHEAQRRRVARGILRAVGPAEVRERGVVRVERVEEAGRADVRRGERPFVDAPQRLGRGGVVGEARLVLALLLAPDHRVLGL